MDHDDDTFGRLLTRRETLALLGLSGAGLMLGCKPEASASRQATSAGVRSGSAVPCIVRPQQTEGPYFVDERLDRSDIRSDPSTGAVRGGALLELAFQVSRAGSGGCTPLAGARVDVSHCDARGVYSDVQDPSFDTSGQKFLRGYQVTDASGAARFTTIYPGWYPGRTVHLHFKIRTPASETPAHEFVSQLYFDDAVTDRVHAVGEYTRAGGRRLRNREDGIFQGGGDRLLLAVSESGRGYAATFEIGLLVS